MSDQRMEMLEQVHLQGAGVRLEGDIVGPPGAPTIVFLHGSGQTRHSWRKALGEAASRGYRAVAIDLRGHGASDWSPDGHYSNALFVADLSMVIEQIGGAPILVGASIGGLVSLLVAASPPPPVRAIVLVDVSPHVAAEGVEEISAFMNSAAEGFASVDEAADAVSAYLTRRPRPKDTSGLARNLRLRDNRYYWHWDPAFHAQMVAAPGHVANAVKLMREAAKSLKVPTLMTRGGNSRVIPKAGAKAFLEMVPHAEHVDIADADHMVAGDANDAFNDAVFAFIDRQFR